MIRTRSIHVADVGVPFDMTFLDQNGFVIDLAGADVREFRFGRPDGTAFARQAAFVTGGRGRYVAAAGDLDQAGTWRVLDYAKVGSDEYHTKVFKSRVKPNIR